MTEPLGSSSRTLWPEAAVPHQDLVRFGLADAFDVEQLLLGSVCHGLDGVEARVLQLLDVAGADSTLLHRET